jgi:hypothetical protein
MKFSKGQKAVINFPESIYDGKIGLIEISPGNTTGLYHVNVEDNILHLYEYEMEESLELDFVEISTKDFLQLVAERDAARAAIRRLAVPDVALEQDLLHHVHEHDRNERQNRKYPGRVAKLRKLLSRLHTILKEDSNAV